MQIKCRVGVTMGRYGFKWGRVLRQIEQPAQENTDTNATSNAAADNPAALVAQMQALMAASRSVEVKTVPHGNSPLCQYDFSGSEPVQALSCGCLYHDVCIKGLSKRSGKPILLACCIPHAFDTSVPIPDDVPIVDVDADVG